MEQRKANLIEKIRAVGDIIYTVCTDQEPINFPVLKAKDIQITIHPRGGEPVGIDYCNGHRTRLNALDIVHELDSKGELLRRYVASHPPSQYRVLQGQELERIMPPPSLKGGGTWD